MPKLRFAILLPILVLCAAFAVARWEHHVQGQQPPKREYPYEATATLIFKGVNAPAVFFKTLCITYLPIYEIDHAPPSFRGMGIAEFLFLVSIFVLWCVVGLVLDRRCVPKARLRREVTTIGVVVNSLLTALGIFLLWAGIIDIRNSTNSTNPLGHVLEGLSFVVWSIVLALPSILTVLKATRLPEQAP